MKEQVIRLLDEPTSKLAKLIPVAILILIYLSIAIVVIEIRLPDWASEHAHALEVINLIILLVFGVELFARIICYERRWQYLTSFAGIVDVLAVLPEFVARIAGVPVDTSWFRVVRILRITRVLKSVHAGSVLGGLTGRVLPYVGLAIGLKGLVLALEGHGWWPTIDNINIMIGVVGFALALLLATKLRVTNDRKYAIEDAVCRIVGGLRDMHANEAISSELQKWSRRLERVLRDPDRTEIKRLQDETNKLEVAMERAGIGGPNSATFHRDVAYVLHRATARTPIAYERFLRHVTIAYSAAVIISVPGLTGLVASAFVVYVLWGTYILIDDMDRPLDYSDNSFIALDLDPIHEFNKSYEGSETLE